MKQSDLPTIQYKILGCLDYMSSLELQNNLVQKKIAGEISDQILILEHPSVITQGKKECDEDFISSKEDIRNLGINIVHIDRGGRLTYHGPGQLIVYFICDVRRLGGVKNFVNSIEEIVIRVLSDFNIEGGRDKDYPGVWVNGSKIAAVGLHISRGISSHGFALNVNCDLEPYRHIVACGIKDRTVTSMRIKTGKKMEIQKVQDRVLHHTAEVFSARLEPRK